MTRSIVVYHGNVSIKIDDYDFPQYEPIQLSDRLAYADFHSFPNEVEGEINQLKGYISNLHHTMNSLLEAVADIATIDLGKSLSSPSPYLRKLAYRHLLGNKVDWESTHIFVCRRWREVKATLLMEIDLEPLEGCKAYLQMSRDGKAYLWAVSNPLWGWEMTHEKIEADSIITMAEGLTSEDAELREKVMKEVREKEDAS